MRTLFYLLCLSAAAFAVPDLEPVARAVPRPATRAVKEAGGGTVEARGSKVLRDGKPMGGDSAGEVRCLVPDPAGLVWIGAENGVFVLDAGAERIERFHALGAAGKGVRDLHLDGRRRLWFLTDSRFGCLDTKLERRRTILTAPDAAFVGFAKDPSAAALVLCAGDGTGFRYVPDSGPRPSIRTLRINGETWDPSAEFRIRYPRNFDIECLGEARGGLHLFAWTHERGRTGVRRKEAGSLRTTRMDPGHLTLVLEGADQDGNRSAPIVLHVDVEWPTHMRPALIGSIGAAGIAVLVLLALWLGKDRRKALLTVFLVVAIGGQLLAAIVPHARGWPFVGFGMYTGKSGPDTITGHVRVELIHADGSLEALDPIDLDCYKSHLAHALEYRTSEAAPALLQFLGTDARGVQLRVQRYILTETGPERVASRIRARYMRSAGDDE